MIPLLLKKVKAKGYRIFTAGHYNVNIIAIRHKGRPNEFDDTIALVYRDESGWIQREFACTTDPGVYWLNNPGRKEGTAVLAPGQYRGTHMIDKHRGKYDALCQRLGKVKVYRDGNKDGVIDWDKFDESVSGMYGINIHRASATRASVSVDRWSAGCIVIASYDDFECFMKVIRKAAQGWGNKFSVTLLEEEDV